MQFTVETPSGPAGVEFDRPDGPPLALLVLGHGAGGGITAPDLLAVRRAALTADIAVARVTQPYRRAGRRAPAPAPRLDDAWLAAVAACRRRRRMKALPLVVGGRSSGARVACRTATAVSAAGVVALAFPLHPPGRPEKSRLDELMLPTVPVLVVQGEADAFGMPPAAPGRQVVVVPGSDHSLKKNLGPASAAVVEFVTTLALRANVGE